MIDVVRDKSTFIDAHRYPEGVEDILMNGGVVIERGKYARTLAGRVLNL